MLNATEQNNRTPWKRITTQLAVRAGFSLRHLSEGHKDDIKWRWDPGQAHGDRVPRKPTDDEEKSSS